MAKPAHARRQPVTLRSRQAQPHKGVGSMAKPGPGEAQPSGPRRTSLSASGLAPLSYQQTDGGPGVHRVVAAVRRRPPFGDP